MSNYQTGTLLRQLREESNYSLQDIANYLGVSKPAVSKWEYGDDIKTENLYALVKLYGVTFSELYEGKLKNELKDQYWKRNFDLSNFEIKDEINNKNIEDVRIMFEHITLVKKTFLSLMPRWANDRLTQDELEEFNMISKYFEFDNNYYSYIKEGPGFISFAFDQKEKKDFVLQRLEEIKSLSKKAQEWELQKIFNFKYDYNEKLIHDSRNLKALEYMLSSFSQIEKDSILYANIHIKEEFEEDLSRAFLGKHKKIVERDRTVDEIEHIPFMKIIINSGANFLYQYKSTPGGWDDEAFEFSDGKKVQIEDSIYNKYLFHNVAGQRFVPILQNWKLYTYEQYVEFIDHNATERLRDIVNLRDSNPLEYYKRMIERSYK